MTEVVLFQRHWQRRDTEANWISVNPVLADGEHGVVTDAGEPAPFKIGNGVDAWILLPYQAHQIAAATGADTITATYDPKPVLFDGLELKLRAAAANTGAATFNPNSLGALAICKQGGAALVAGDIAAAGHELILRYRASVPRWELLNPYAISTIADDSVTNAKLANMATTTIKARKTGSTGDPEDCTLSEVLDFIGSAAHGDILYRGASSWVRLAAGTPGQYLKTLGAGANPAWDSPSAGSGISSGTSNPGSPANNDLFYRTDLDLLIFYDGTRWMTVQEYTLAHMITDGQFPITATGQGNHRWPVPADYGIYLTKLHLRAFHSTGNGSNFWIFTFNRVSLTNVSNNIVSNWDTSANTQAQFNDKSQTINAVLDASACEIELKFTKLSSPAALYAIATLQYRKIIT